MKWTSFLKCLLFPSTWTVAILLMCMHSALKFWVCFRFGLLCFKIFDFGSSCFILFSYWPYYPFLLVIWLPIICFFTYNNENGQITNENELRGLYENGIKHEGSERKFWNFKGQNENNLKFKGKKCILVAAIVWKPSPT